MVNKIYPIGYSAGGAQQRVEQLMGDPKVLLIDCRKVPYSWRVEWKQSYLQEKYGERYRWAGKVLGNRNYQGGPIDIVNLAVGVRGLQMYLDEGHDLIILCECGNWSTCHRKVIVERLQEVCPSVEVIQPKHVDTMMCLSIQQPWTWLLAHGLKDIENRGWTTTDRGPILLHAGKKPESDSFCDDGTLSPYYERKYGFTLASTMPQIKIDYPTGAIVGMAELVDVVTESDSRWFQGPCGFVLKNARPFAMPIPYPGQRGLFPVPREIIANASYGVPLAPVTLKPPDIVSPAEAQSLRVIRTIARCDCMVISLDDVMIRLFNGLRDVAGLTEQEYGMLNTELLRLELAEMKQRPRKKVGKR
jgi:hypothetical protein